MKIKSKIVAILQCDSSSVGQIIALPEFTIFEQFVVVSTKVSYTVWRTLVEDAEGLFVLPEMSADPVTQILLTIGCTNDFRVENLPQIVYRMVGKKI